MTTKLSSLSIASTVVGFFILELLCKSQGFESQISSNFSVYFADIKVWGFQMLEGLKAYFP